MPRVPFRVDWSVKYAAYPMVIHWTAKLGGRELGGERCSVARWRWLVGPNQGTATMTLATTLAGWAKTMTLATTLAGAQGFGYGGRTEEGCVLLGFVVGLISCTLRSRAGAFDGSPSSPGNW